MPAPEFRITTFWMIDFQLRHGGGLWDRRIGTVAQSASSSDQSGRASSQSDDERLPGHAVVPRAFDVTADGRLVNQLPPLPLYQRPAIEYKSPDEVPAAIDEFTRPVLSGLGAHIVKASDARPIVIPGIVDRIHEVRPFRGAAIEVPATGEHGAAERLLESVGLIATLSPARTVLVGRDAPGSDEKIEGSASPRSGRIGRLLRSDPSRSQREECNGRRKPGKSDVEHGLRETRES
jgi:hypothetical protein